MNFSKRALEGVSGVFLVRSRRFADSRGYFFEAWSKEAFVEIGIDADFIQDNVSLSDMAGTLRGLHLQLPPFEQSKLVSVLRGAIYDVVVDLRPQSETLGRWFGVSMTSGEGEMLFVPRGFAHGFITLTDDTIVTYKVDAPYAKDFETGIRWNDPKLNIPWPEPKAGVVLSDKDAILPYYEEGLKARR